MILFTQVVELERLRRELAYRKQLHEQQNAMISQQRAQLSMGQVIINFSNKSAFQQLGN